MVRVYTPTSEYSKQTSTKVEKDNFFSGLINYGKRIIANSFSTSASERILYTVPPGKVFFLISLNSEICSYALNGGSIFKVYIDTDLSATNLCQLFVEDSLGNLKSSAVSALSFSIPLILKAGESIRLKGGDSSSTETGASITGYEVDSSLIPTFI